MEYARIKPSKDVSGGRARSRVKKTACCCESLRRDLQSQQKHNGQTTSTNRSTNGAWASKKECRTRWQAAWCFFETVLDAGWARVAVAVAVAATDSALLLLRCTPLAWPVRDSATASLIAHACSQRFSCASRPASSCFDTAKSCRTKNESETSPSWSEINDCKHTQAHTSTHKHTRTRSHKSTHTFTQYPAVHL